VVVVVVVILLLLAALLLLLAVEGFAYVVAIITLSLLRDAVVLVMVTLLLTGID